MPRLLPSTAPWHWLALTGYIVVLLAGVALLALAALPIGLFKPAIERRLSARFGRPVTIAAIERRGGLTLSPIVVIRGLRVPQASWAGGGDLARIDRATVRLAVWPLLHARIAPSSVEVSGMRLVLIRDAAGRESWHGPRPDRKGGGAPTIAHLRIADSTLTYRDAKRDRAFTAAITADPVHGVRLAGGGVVRGSPVRIAFAGASVEGSSARWPFRVTIDGPALTMIAAGTMATALDTDRMALDVTARAADLRLIDAIVEAGLFATQPVRLHAHVEHDVTRWRLTDLNSTIGRSDIAGHVTVEKASGRNRLSGAITSRQLDLADLSSDAGLARGAALERAIGPRLVPDMRIDLSHITRTDGQLAISADRIVSRTGPSSLTSARGMLAIDHQRLTVAPLTVGLRRGTLSGRAIVEQRGGRAVPLVTLDLRVTNSDLAALGAAAGSITGRVDARIRLAGLGETIRAAVGRASGRIGVTVRDGTLPQRTAAALGFDAGRALLAGDSSAGLRCAIVGVRVDRGRGTIEPMIVDTTLSQLRGTGSVLFPDETLAIRLTGAPKHGSVLRLPGAALLGGRLRAPSLVVPPEVRSAGNVLKAIGRAISGHQGPTASDADCAGLSARMLR